VVLYAEGTSLSVEMYNDRRVTSFVGIKVRSPPPTTRALARWKKQD